MRGRCSVSSWFSSFIFINLSPVWASVSDRSERITLVESGVQSWLTLWVCYFKRTAGPGPGPGPGYENSQYFTAQTAGTDRSSKVKQSCGLSPPRVCLWVIPSFYLWTHIKVSAPHAAALLSELNEASCGPWLCHTLTSSVLLLKRGQPPEESRLYQPVVKTNILLYLEPGWRATSQPGLRTPAWDWPDRDWWGFSLPAVAVLHEEQL